MISSSASAIQRAAKVFLNLQQEPFNEDNSEETLEVGNDVLDELSSLSITENGSSVSSSVSIPNSDKVANEETSVKVGSLKLKSLNQGEDGEDLECLPCITLAEVRSHSSSDDAWIVFYDRVYDITDFIVEVARTLILYPITNP